MMEKTVKILKTAFWTSITLGLIMVAIYETEILLPGDLSGNAMLEYYLTLVMELFTIIIIPTALRLFRLKSIRTWIKGNPKHHLYLSLIRMAMIAVPMLANALLYYLFILTTFGYMGIICLLCMVFVYPSKQRCDSEISMDEE